MAKKKLRPDGLGLVLNQEIEDQLALWVRDHREQGIPIPRLILQLQSQVLAETCGITEFKCSDTWVKSFFDRYGFLIRTKTRTGQETPYDANLQAELFCQAVIAKCFELNVTIS